MPEKSTNGNTVIEKNDEEVFEPLERSKLGTEEWGEGFAHRKDLNSYERSRLGTDTVNESVTRKNSDN